MYISQTGSLLLCGILLLMDGSKSFEIAEQRLLVCSTAEDNKFH